MASPMRGLNKRVVVNFGLLIIFLFGVVYFMTNYISHPNVLPLHMDGDCEPNLSPASFFSQSGEDRGLLERYFSAPYVCRGVFVELGALDGIKYSNTKFFEEQMGWRGVLIEGQPDNARALATNRPRAVTVQEAVCPAGTHNVTFTGRAGDAVGGLLDAMTPEHLKRYLRDHVKDQTVVPCRPLGDILHASGVSKVDFFILDVEGGERIVLDTMDWDIPVRVWVVEVGRGEDRDKEVIEMFLSHGYVRSEWDIRTFCPKDKRKYCGKNVVFELPDFFERIAR